MTISSCESPPLMVRFNKSGFNNERFMNEYFDKIIIPFYCRVKRESNKKVVFIMDDASFHKSQSLVNKCANLDLYIVILPGGTTNILQPLDVAITKHYKDIMKEKYKEWLIEEFNRTNIEDIKESLVIKAGNINLLLLN